MLELADNLESNIMTKKCETIVVVDKCIENCALIS